MREGYGKFTWKSGDTFTGNFVDDNFAGFGVLENKEMGSRYEGEFFNNQIDGFGTFVWKNGD